MGGSAQNWNARVIKFWRDVNIVPSYLTHGANWTSLWPLLIAIILIPSIIFLIFFRIREVKGEVYIILLSFSSLGMATGYLTGLSRESAVGDVIPATLSLIGGLSIYMIGKNKESRIPVSLSVLVFSVCLILGTSWGAVLRQESVYYLQSKQFLKKKAITEKEVKDFRISLGLDESPP